MRLADYLLGFTINITYINIFIASLIPHNAHHLVGVTMDLHYTRWDPINTR